MTHYLLKTQWTEIFKIVTLKLNIAIVLAVILFWNDHSLRHIYSGAV